MGNKYTVTLTFASNGGSGQGKGVDSNLNHILLTSESAVDLVKFDQSEARSTRGRSWNYGT